MRVSLVIIMSYVPFELSLTSPEKHFANLVHNHHNSNDVPKVYIPSTMIETCIILQCLSSSENRDVRTYT